jgi:uncharacterized protein YbbK (DUF523 family)
VQTTDSLHSTGQPAASAELVKQLRKESRQKFLDKIRDSLDSVTHQLALTPTQAAIACSRSPTWGYRRVYDGTFKVINSEDGRLLIPRSEIERYLGSAEKYNPAPKAKIGGDENGRS